MNIQLGSFINKENLELLNGNISEDQTRFFSNPLTSFQLLGPTLWTQNCILS